MAMLFTREAQYGTLYWDRRMILMSEFLLLSRLLKMTEEQLAIMTVVSGSQVPVAVETLAKRFHMRRRATHRIVMELKGRGMLEPNRSDDSDTFRGCWANETLSCSGPGTLLMREIFAAGSLWGQLLR